MSSGSSKATWPPRLRRQRVSTTVLCAAWTTSKVTGPCELTWASSRMAEAGDSLVSKKWRKLAETPARASRTWGSGTWSSTARRSLASSSPRSSMATRSDKDLLLTVGVGKGDAAVVMEASESFGEVGLGGLGVVEPERADSGQLAPQGRSGRRRQGAQHLGADRPGGPGQGQGPGRGVLVVVRLP